MSGCKLTREYYEHLIQQDIDALVTVPRSEREHIDLVLRESVVIYYDVLPAIFRVLNNQSRDGDVEILDRVIDKHLKSHC